MEGWEIFYKYIYIIAKEKKYNKFEFINIDFLKSQWRKYSGIIFHENC